MPVISEADFINSVADALQYISYYHPPDFIAALTRAYERERSGAAGSLLFAHRGHRSPVARCGGSSTAETINSEIDTGV